MGEHRCQQQLDHFLIDPDRSYTLRSSTVVMVNPRTTWRFEWENQLQTGGFQLTCKHAIGSGWWEHFQERQWFSSRCPFKAICWIYMSCMRLSKNRLLYPNHDGWFMGHGFQFATSNFSSIASEKSGLYAAYFQHQWLHHHGEPEPKRLGMSGRTEADALPGARDRWRWS